MTGTKIVIEFRLGGRTTCVAITPLEFEHLKNLPPDLALGRILESRGHPGAAALLEEAARGARLRLDAKREDDKSNQKEGRK